jgi:hypothetical protein
MAILANPKDQLKTPSKPPRNFKSISLRRASFWSGAVAADLDVNPDLQPMVVTA